MRILITGAAGQLGTDLVRHCTEAGDDVIACTSAQLDLGHRDSVAQAITGARPDVVVNAGAWTAVDACEADPDKAWRINALRQCVAVATQRNRNRCGNLWMPSSPSRLNCRGNASL